MSYEKVKRIRFEGNKVFITSCSNNVSPKDYNEWECTSLSKIMEEKGKRECELEILHAYEDGCLQGVKNKYMKAIIRLRRMDEYKRYNWRGEPYEEIQKNRKENRVAFDILLWKAFETKDEKRRCVVQIIDSGSIRFVKRVNVYKIRSCFEIANAKVFDNHQEAEEVVNRLKGRGLGLQVLDFPSEETVGDLFKWNEKENQIQGGRQ